MWSLRNRSCLAIKNIYTSGGLIYYAKRKARDDEARAAYQREFEIEDLNGIFMRDIIWEEMKPDDIRLR